MNCELYRKRIHDDQRGDVGADEHGQLVAHSASCRSCREYLAQCEELTCHDFVTFLGEYVEEQLDAARRATFERHLAVCTDCTNYLDGYRRTMRLGVRALGGQAPVPGAIPEALVRAILDARRRTPKPD